MERIINPLVISNPFLIGKSPLGQILRNLVDVLTKYSYTPTIICMNEKTNVDWHNSCSYICAVNQSHLIKFFIAIVRRLFPDITYLPDTEYYSWGKRAFKSSVGLVKEKEFDYIHSISFSCACHLVGYRVKRKTKLPWVAQFYDPWYDNPDRRFRTRLFKKFDLMQEKLVADHADLIIIYTQRMIEYWKKRYGDAIQNKILYLPMTISSNLPEIKKHSRTGKLKIVHIGNFQLKRTSEPFIRAMYKLKQKNADLFSKINVTFVGNVTVGEVALIKDLHLIEYFDLVGRVDEEKCNSYYQNADIFLAVDAPFEKNVFYPSKVMKYFYFDRPILGITPTGSVLSEEMTKSGHRFIDNNDIDGIVEYLENALENYDSLLNYNHKYWEQFSVDNVVRNYVDSIEKYIIKK